MPVHLNRLNVNINVLLFVSIGVASRF